MTDGWVAGLTELVPLALVVAISPLSIIPAVLVLHTARPKPTSLAFLAGWIFGLAAVTALFVEVSSLLGGLDKAPTWASWLRVVTTKIQPSAPARERDLILSRSTILLERGGSVAA